MPKGKAIKTAKIVDNIANSKDNPIRSLSLQIHYFLSIKRYLSHLLGAQSYIIKLHHNWVIQSKALFSFCISSADIIHLQQPT